MAASPLAAALLAQGGGNPAAFLDPSVAAAQPDLQLGQSMIQQGLSTAPASPWQALARIAQTGAGTYLQKNAISDLAKAYAHTSENAAATLPEGHPLRAALNSSDPVIRMQGLQAYQKALTLLSEPSNVGPGDNRYVGSAVLASNTRPRSDLGKTQEDIDNAGGGSPQGPAAAVPQAMPPAPGGGAPGRPAGVPLNAPRMGGIESVTGMGPTVPGMPGGGAPGVGSPTGSPAVPMTAPSFNERYSASRPSGVQPTSVPSNPLQGAIDLEAKKVAANKSAEANVEYGELLKPVPKPAQGPGGTEPLEVYHNDPKTNTSQKTTIPALTDQAPVPTNPAQLKDVLPAWQKTKEGWQSGLQPGYQAEQRLNTIAQTFKTMQTGYGAEQKAQVAALLKSIGVNLPESIMADPAKVETAIHENYVETLQQLKATTPRFTQMEFKALSENKEHPNLQPAANLTMLSEDIGQLRQARDLPRDFGIAQGHGWRDPQSFEQAWLRQNPLKTYVDGVRKEIGPLKGMAPDSVVGAAGAASGPAVGYEHNGYRFKGGDPNAKTSWEKAAP